MKKAVVLLCILSIALSPSLVYAAYETIAGNEPKPLQQLTEQQYVDNTNVVKEPASFDWSTGKGRKDTMVRWAVDDNYLKKMPGMIVRGFSNTAFGWIEIFRHPFTWSKNAPIGTGYITGLIMGPVVAVLRMTSGVVDLATFWVPFWNGIPMPDPVLGLHEVNHYDTIEDAGTYDYKTKRYFFNKLSKDF